VHDGSLGNALNLIDLAAQLGADIVKFQTHIAAAETLRDAPMPPYFKGEPRFEYFQRTGFTAAQWRQLKEHADACGIEFISSPFSIEAVDLLESIGMGRYKIPSGEVTNLPYLAYIAKLKKPVILSSGMSSWAELDAAVNTIRAEHNDLCILQCTSEYPTPYEQVGLNILGELRERYQTPVGFSDHTSTIFAPLAAVSLGATVIEKHLTFSRAMYGSDAKNALEPAEFAQMVAGIRAIETMLATPIDKNAIERYQTMKEIFEKSIVAAVDIPAHTVITAPMLAFKKPGTGIPAAEVESVLGKTSRQHIAKDTLIRREQFK